MINNTDNILHNNPDLYDVFEDDKNLAMGKFIENVLKQYKVEGAVLDIGSGLGREAGYLTNKGFEVVGIDNSDEMVKWAREHYSSANFILMDQTNFHLNNKFNAVYCVGSTFLYNYTNEDAIHTIQHIREHCNKEAILYMDMRNAAFFLTDEGQIWLKDPIVEDVNYKGKNVRLITRFSIDNSSQILLRKYEWQFEEGKTIVENLKHRLFFPMEIKMILENNGFKVEKIFDHPAPHIGDIAAKDEYSTKMTGRRMQIVAKAV